MYDQYDFDDDWVHDYWDAKYHGVVDHCLYLSLVPVAGVLISMIPLTLLGFASGGLIRVVWIIVLVILIHAFESYFLHPRLMADRTDLPVFVTFITLIIMESLLGAWGLIIGIPIVSFFLDILGVQNSEPRRDVSNSET